MKPRDQAARVAVSRGHSRLAKATLHRPGSFVPLELPISGGSVEFSLSRNAERSGTLEVAGYPFEDLLSPRHYGWIVIEVGIDGWKWSLGEFPIVAVEAEEPGGKVVATLGDWSYRRSRSRAEGPADSLALGTSIASMAGLHLSHVMPWPVTCTRDDTGGAMMPSEAKVSPGGDVWAAMQQAAGLADARLVMPSRTEVHVRRYDPSAAPQEDLDGLLHRGTRRTSAQDGDACNRVIVRVEGAGPDAPTYTGVQTLTAGPYAYSKDGFGFAQIVETPRLMSATQAAADAEAVRIANRRFGALKTVDVRIPVLPWLELGDVVTVMLAGRREEMLVETMTVPLLANQSMRLQGRDGGWSGG